jgi:FkbM family methyltransferase
MQLGAKRILVKLTGRKKMQGLMNKLYLLGLTGMNYGNANMLNITETGEKGTIEYIARKLSHQTDFIFFDAGANIGSYSEAVVQVLHDKNVKIYAFEPVAYTFSLLSKAIGGLKDIHLFNHGLGDKEETLTIYSNFETSGAATLYNHSLNMYKTGRRLTEQVSVKTLDAVCATEAVSGIDFLKLDVEGHELKVLQGAQGLLCGNRIRFIQFEFGPCNVYSRTYFKDFWDLLSGRYSIYRILNNGLCEIKSYNESLEIFRTANFLAELKNTGEN